MKGDQHVYPVEDLVDHDTESRTCWCRPRIVAPCDEHDEDQTCWKCAPDGLVDLTGGEAQTALVIHNAADGRT